MSSEFQGIGMTSQRSRDRLVSQLRDMDIQSEVVLEVIKSTPRHIFIDEALASRAYDNTALPIGHNQTISQPYIVALMTDLLDIGNKDAVVLEVGTGCGYQTAILAEIARQVYSIEIIKELAEQADRRMKDLDYTNVKIKAGDGYLGWPEHAPFDGILVTAAAPEVPMALIEQLKPGGRLVIPVGARFMTQNLMLIRKNDDASVTQQAIIPVSFVPFRRSLQSATI